MRTIYSTRTLAVPEGVKVSIKTRTVTVTGPRGSLTRSFAHQALDLILEKDGKLIRAELWFGNRKYLACIRTVLTHIRNMMTGVTKGYLYKMKLVYNHFPISITMEKAGKEVQIRNFLGEKEVRIVDMIDEVVCKRSEGEKDEIQVSGNNVDAVSQSAANIQQSIRVTDKDIRKYLDGCYVAWKGHVVQEE